MSASPAEIAKRLTKAQRKALLVLPLATWIGWEHDLYPEASDLCDAVTGLWALVHQSEGTCHLMVSPTGERVRAELERMEARDADPA